MTYDLDTAKAVLAKASLYDQTFATPDLAIAVAWSEALKHVDKADALEAVADHYSSLPRRIMPADVLAGVRRIRAERIRRQTSDVLEPPYEEVRPDNVLGYLEAVRERRRKLAAGEPLEQLAAAADHAADVHELLHAAVKALPEVTA